MMRVLDLFSAAAGGWSLGLHRAGFVTVAACEIVEWRRILYSENFPHVRLYEDIRDLTAARLVSDLGFLPDIVVGSPPCQDISVANTKGKGVEGERSSLYFEAIRIIGECRPRWFALENSAHLRTRGADRVLGELEALGYATEPCVVAAAHVGANHERKRSWLIGFDPEQLADTRVAIPAGWVADGGRIGSAQGDEGIRPLRRLPEHDVAHPGGGNKRLEPRRGSRQIGAGASFNGDDDPQWRHAADAKEVGRGSRRQGRRALPASGSRQPPCGDADAESIGHEGGRTWRHRPDGHGAASSGTGERAGNAADTDEARQPDGRLEPGLRPKEVADHGRGDGRGDAVANPGSDRQPDSSSDAEMGGRESTGSAVAEPWADWNGGLAHHLRVDDGLSAWVADTRIAVGGSRGTAAAGLVVEAFGDAVVPQIPEAIGRAILRTEMALNSVYGAFALSISSPEHHPSQGHSGRDDDGHGDAP